MNKIIIALIVTSGTRPLEKSINSILEQTKKVDHIFIASEKEINTTYQVFLNPYKKGLARNTNQALIKIKELFQNENIFIATLDDDDTWNKDYIYQANNLIDEGYNFITGWVEVYNQNQKKDEWIFKKEEININNFLLRNIGMLGSNKIFNLDIALESGGMSKSINRLTDRFFNISLLMHPEIKVGLINDFVIKYNKDSNRDRITNDLSMENDLKNFYRHFDALINDDDVLKINERHDKIHQIKGAISWR